MSQKIVELVLSDELYEQLQQIADASHRTVQAVVLESVGLLYGENTIGTDVTLEQLQNLSDEQLWSVIYRQLSLPEDSRLRQLVALGKKGALTDAEDQEMEMLIDRVDRYMILRSQALLVLQQRGHDIKSYLFPSNT